MLDLPLQTLRCIDFGTGVDDCWVWTGARTRDGYGKAGDGVAHRRIWVRLGYPLDYSDLHHRCGTRLCVRPSHLEPMTAEEHQRHHFEQATCLEGHPYVRRYGRQVCMACDARRQRAYKARKRVTA